ncbi:helix-turn-helix domain-containing protein [Mycetocola zhadangensis]|uniref:helix-turn-helix domain-containing protein n=1 Tax=Mycetocola zhadangensis TaxID=1164595 RepID=UPI003A4E65CF
MTEPRAARRPPAAPAGPAPVVEVRARQPKAIHSALTVLEEVARLGAGAGVTAQEISQSLGLPRATTYRLINLLAQDEYLVRMPDLTGFALGRKVVELASLVAPPPPPQAVRDVIADLRSRIRGGIHLVRYEGDRILIVDADPDFPLSDESRITLDLTVSAMGRLLLAERAGDASPSGYASQTGELMPGYGCLALPICAADGRLVGRAVRVCTRGPDRQSV